MSAKKQKIKTDAFISDKLLRAFDIRYWSWVKFPMSMPPFNPELASMTSWKGCTDISGRIIISELVVFFAFHWKHDAETPELGTADSFQRRKEAEAIMLLVIMSFK